jgi:ATP-dependent Lhr-like helicase
VTLIIGTPIKQLELKKEILSSHTYRNLSDKEWNWAIEFITNGGSLKAYPQYQKAVLKDDYLSVPDKKIIQLHRMNIGTITSSTSITVKYQTGIVLGTIEEYFLTRLKPGSQFIFSGKRLELVRFHKLAAVVKRATKKVKGSVPTWSGGKMPLSSELSQYVANQITDPDDGVEMNAVKSILKIQSNWSALPSQNYLLVEFTALRGSQNLFFFPFAGRLVHEGLSALVAYRMTKTTAESIHVTQNDYGFSLSSRSGLSLDEDEIRHCFSSDGLHDDLEACMNTAEMARKQFNEIARVAGLITQQRPGKRKTHGDMQISSKLLFEVLEKYDPNNLLLHQAKNEILSRQLQISRLNKTMQKIQGMPFKLKETRRLTPMAFPLWADRLSAYLPAGDAATRLEKMLNELQQAALSMK